MNPVPDRDELQALADADTCTVLAAGGWDFRGQAEITPAGDVVWAAL